MQSVTFKKASNTLFLKWHPYKTSAEMTLSFLAYKIKRAINILGVAKMIEALG
jgi:hypothetical protein